MAENSLLGKLDGLVSRFEEVGTLITDPAVIADMKRFVKLNKEYRDLEKIVEAKALLESEQDPEMREMAREELDTCNERIPALEEEIKLLLVPADPQDDKNAIVEIRGGTGGDEAALFAGDLYRMYVKYCELKGWKISVSSFSEGSSGGFKEIIFTAYSAYRLRRRKDVYIPPPPRSPYCLRRMNLMLRLMKGRLNGIPSAPVVPVVRT